MSNKSRKNRKKKNRTRGQIFRRVFFISLLIFSLLGTGMVYVYDTLNKVDQVEIATDDQDLGIKDDPFKDRKVINIALFGIDRREDNEVSRSDSIMIATIDKEHKKIKLTSLLRDIYVEIPGYGMDKLNHAYSYSGPELAIKTINHNFNMNIREFAAVDFFGLEEIIDVMGGVEVDVQPNEVGPINTGVKQVDKFDNSNSPLVKDSGKQKLTGRQAVAYARIRRIGTDYQRTERQRIVLEDILNQGINAGVAQYPKLLNAMLPHVETSLSKSEILSLGTSTLTAGIKTIDKYRIPVKGYVDTQTINGVSYEVPDTMADNIQFLQDFIYEDKKVEDE